MLLKIVFIVCKFTIIKKHITAKFEEFFKSYIDKFKYKSVCTEDFKSFLMSYFNDDKTVSCIDWNSWLYTCGMPPIIPL